MTRIMNRKMTCFICGRQSEYHVLLSTNFSGSPDLDLRGNGMGAILLESGCTNAPTAVT